MTSKESKNDGNDSIEVGNEKQIQETILNETSADASLTKNEDELIDSQKEYTTNESTVDDSLIDSSEDDSVDIQGKIINNDSIAADSRTENSEGE
jgi:hypothetical protein